MRGKSPSNLAFGGPDGKTVYVTQVDGGYVVNILQPLAEDSTRARAIGSEGFDIATIYLGNVNCFSVRATES